MEVGNHILTPTEHVFKSCNFLRISFSSVGNHVKETANRREEISESEFPVYLKWSVAVCFIRQFVNLDHEPHMCHKFTSFIAFADRNTFSHFVPILMMPIKSKAKVVFMLRGFL